MQAQGKPINVTIEYCGSWGYYSKFSFAQNKILAAFPHAKVDGVRVGGSTGCFEVKVNGQLVHSKLKGEGFVTEQNAPAMIEKIKAL